MNGKLILLPNLLDIQTQSIDLLPSNISSIVQELDGLFAESEKTARRYLFKFLPREKAFSLPILLINEHTQKKDYEELLAPLKNQKWGLISDAGLPCLADPGSMLVYLANKNQILVEAYMGPSSIILGLMLSGLPSQSFSFLGYLPKEEEPLIKKLKSLESISSKEGSTQMWIEAPYRSKKMFNLLLQTLQDKTLLCVAVNLTFPNQKVITRSILEWKKSSDLNLEKDPAVFLICSNDFFSESVVKK